MTRQLGGPAIRAQFQNVTKWYCDCSLAACGIVGGRHLAPAVHQRDGREGNFRRAPTASACSPSGAPIPVSRSWQIADNRNRPPLKNPAPCFDGLILRRAQESGSPPQFHWRNPLTLSLSKGAQFVFQQRVYGSMRVTARSYRVAQKPNASASLTSRPIVVSNGSVGFHAPSHVSSSALSDWSSMRA